MSPDTTAAPTSTPAPTKDAAATASATTPRPTATPQPAAAPALTQLEDKDPGPPFSVEISANRATVDPLDAQNVTYKVTGLVRNTGSDTYTVSAIHITFFDASGFRGSFYRFPQPWETGGEWVWHGKTEAAFGCLLLAPGETCPFGVEITARNMASFLVHADATATGRQSVPVTLSGLRATRDGSSYVRITGMATNSNSFAVKNVNVAGTLLDARRADRERWLDLHRANRHRARRVGVGGSAPPRRYLCQLSPVRAGGAGIAAQGQRRKDSGARIAARLTVWKVSLRLVALDTGVQLF